MRLDRKAAAVVALAVGAMVMSGRPASAQGGTPSGVGGAVEGIGGWAGFADDAPIHHGVIGVAVPFQLARQLRVGPELLYMIGPGSDRDTLLFASLWYDLIARGPGAGTPRPLRFIPYLTVGGGLFHHSDQFVSVSDPYLGAGLGARVRMADRLYVAPEFQVGWELHLRFVTRVGYEWRAR